MPTIHIGNSQQPANDNNPTTSPQPGTPTTPVDDNLEHADNSENSDFIGAPEPPTPGGGIPSPYTPPAMPGTTDEVLLTNPNAIKVNIIDQQTPIVVFFGPPFSGKTMIMLRMARWLSDPKQGYKVSPIRSFRDSQDTQYQQNCVNFNNMVNSVWAAEKSQGIDFMLLNVAREGSPIVQILEAPGEHYFNPADAGEPYQQFAPYIHDIINSPNRKVWCFMTEPNWADPPICAKYVQKIQLLQKMISRRDKSIVIYNKVDASQYFLKNGRVNQRAAERDVNNSYHNIFQCFRNENPITSLWKPYDCTFVPFNTGTYDTVIDNGEEHKRFTAGSDAFPALLWQVIMKNIGR